MSQDAVALAVLLALGVALPLMAWAILRSGRGREREEDEPSDLPEPASKGPAFKPETAALLRQVGIEGPYVGEASDETYAVHCACVEIANRTFRELGADGYKKAVWPADAALLDALRRALPAHAGTYAAHDLAYTLVRCGQDGPDVVQALHPMKGLAFTWREKGYTGAAIALLLRAGKVDPGLEPARVAALDGWIRAPRSALDQESSVAGALFGSRLVYASLQDVGYEPRHDQLLAELAKAAVPPVVLADVRQEIAGEERFRDVTATTLIAARDAPDVAAVLSDQGSHWMVEYVHGGEACGFLARCNATWMDADAVLGHFDELLARTGHSDRVFRVQDGNDFWGSFVVAPATFPQLARTLGIPLQARD